MLSLFRKAPKLLPKPEYCYVLRPCAERIIDLFYLGKNYNSFYFPPHKFFFKKSDYVKGTICQIEASELTKIKLSKSHLTVKSTWKTSPDLIILPLSRSP